MILIIGGKAQGKTEYARMEYGREATVFDDLQDWFREELLAGRDPEAGIISYVTEHPDAVIICNEVGNGIVPMEPFERDYRERLGRTLIKLAKHADSVIRVICGIGQKLK